jgi:hypothetical protein
LKLPYVKEATVQSIIDEIYAKNETFGVDEFSSIANLEVDNTELALILYSFIEAIADYLSQDDPQRMDELSCIAKIACNLTYKSLEKQLEINEM